MKYLIHISISSIRNIESNQQVKLREKAAHLFIQLNFIANLQNRFRLQSTIITKLFIKKEEIITKRDY